MSKTLWMFQLWEGRAALLIPLYATDVSDADQQARAWAKERGVELHGAPTLLHYPRGFTLVYEELPGVIDEERPEVQ